VETQSPRSSAVVLALAAIGSVVVVGMRAKSPFPLNAVPQDQPRDKTASSYRGSALLPARRPTNLRWFGAEQCLQLQRGGNPRSGGAGRGSRRDFDGATEERVGSDSRAEMWLPCPGCVRASSEGRRRRSCRGERGTPRAPGRLARPFRRASRSTPPEARPARRASTSSWADRSRS
jgi:hypothetical protein